MDNVTYVLLCVGFPSLTGATRCISDNLHTPSPQAVETKKSILSLVASQALKTQNEMERQSYMIFLLVTNNAKDRNRENNDFSWEAKDQLNNEYSKPNL